MATRWLGRIEERLRQVRVLPMSGAPRRELAEDLRVVFCGDYAIYYLPGHDELIVVRVLHGSRDVESIANFGGLVF